MKTLVSAMLLVLSAALLLPSNARAFSNADVHGCYVVQAEGYNLDPSSMQQIPFRSVFKFCANGAGTITWFAGVDNTAGCSISDVRINPAGASAYSVDAYGNGVVSVEGKAISVTDRCGGMAPSPIQKGDRIRFSIRFMLDRNLIMHAIVTGTELPDNPEVPAIPTVGSGQVYRQ